jgi:hypothetical protein
LCTPTINNIATNRTLIDGGAGLNIISVEVFEKMKVPYHRLMPTRPFFRVTEGSTMPIGQVRLPVTFGTRDNYRTESLDFDVAYIVLPYNAILGYPALARFMAAASWLQRPQDSGDQWHDHRALQREGRSPIYGACLP